MNSRTFNSVVLQNLRNRQFRYLSVQRNINKCSSTCHAANFQKKKENRSSSFIFTKLLNDRTLCESSLPVYTHFQRNFSGTSRLKGPEKLDPLKDLASIPPPEEIKSVVTNAPSSDVVDNIFVEYAQYLLLGIQEGTQLPWWASIVLTTCLVRTTIVLPWSIHQIRMMAKLEKVNIDIQEIDKQFKRETIKAQKEYGWPEHLANQKYEEAKDQAWWNMVKKENCHPMKTYFLINFQLVTWLSITSALFCFCDPNLVGQTIPQQMTTGGFGWITDLTVPDAYLVLPLALGFTNLCVTEVHQSFKVLRKTKREQWKCLFFRVLSVATIPLAAYTPAAINLYWLSSSFYGLVQALLLNSSPVRRIFRVPMNDPGLKQPYRYLLKTTKERLNLTKGESAIAAK